MDAFILKKNRIGRWIIVCPCCQRAWSGSRFVSVDPHGDLITVQVYNYESAAEAAKAAEAIEVQDLRLRRRALRDPRALTEGSKI
jgi:hypothetical protein